MTSPVSVDDYRTLARKRLPKLVFDYLEGGAEEEAGIAHNRAMFARIKFRPRRLVDVARRTVSATLLGKPIRAPLVIGPTGLNGALWPNGDVALARAASRFGIPFVLSTASNQSIEEVAKSCDGELWFQLYVVHRELAARLTSRALDAGYKTLVLTVDVSVNGKRERDLRNKFSMPFRYSARAFLDGVRHPRWLLDFLKHGTPQLANFAGGDALSADVQAAVMARQMDATFDWDDLARLRDRWPHTLLVKGVLRADDAVRCVAAGVDGVILSNHGGRQLDGAVAPIEIVESVRGSVDGAVRRGLDGTVRSGVENAVLIDSGIRRGADVVKALALGASAVLLGRAALYGLAAGGENGVISVLSLLNAEIDNTLAQIGCASISQLTRDFLDPTHGGGERQHSGQHYAR